MKLLLYSHFFWPSIGGLETITDTMARHFTEEGHTVTVITDTPATEEPERIYQVIRGPGRKDLRDIIERHDLVHTQNVSLSFFARAFPIRRPYVCTFQGYQLQSLDMVGWTNGRTAPLTPLASFRHHCRTYGLPHALNAGARLLLARTIAHAASANIAITNHVAQRQPLPNQYTIYNPVNIDRFAVRGLAEAEQDLNNAASTFTFVGRLITDKGVSDLLHAFAKLSNSEYASTGKRSANLRVIGDGPERQSLQALATSLGVAEQVSFLGAKSGEELASEVHRSGICVVPSAYEEPGGIVAVEFLAAGKPVIVSSRGGLSEHAGSACLTFPNHDWQALSQVMQELRADREQQLHLIRIGLERAKEFNPRKQCLPT